MEKKASADRYELAYEHLESKRAAIPRSELATVNLDVPAAIVTIAGVLPKIGAMRQQIFDTFKNFDFAYLDGLEERLDATVQAQGAYAVATAPPADLPALNERGLVLREMLMADGVALSKHGYLNPARLAEVKGLTGYRNLAFDLVSLTSIFREVWSQIEGRTSMQWSILEEARELASKLIAGAGAREQAPETVSVVTDQRQRAVTMLLRAYDEIRDAVSYVRRHEGDADTITPSLYAGRGGRGKKNDAQTSTPATTAPVAAPAPAAPAVPHAEPGMPGASPFVGS